MSTQNNNPIEFDIEEILNNYQDMVYRIALTYCKNTHDAKDITQEVFFNYLKSDISISSEEHLKAWLIRVTINECKTLLHSAWFQRTQPLDDNISFSEKSHSRLYEVILKLPKFQRISIYLFYYEEYSIKEISDMLNKKESTIRSYLHRARKKLKSLLEEELNNE